MPLDPNEALADLLAGAGIAQEVLSAIQALPPKAERKTVDILKVLGITAGPIYKLGALVDKVEADIAS